MDSLMLDSVNESVAKQPPRYMSFLNKSGGDFDSFIGQINTVPYANKQKLLQEKMTLVNTRFAEICEEMNTVMKVNQGVRNLFRYLNSLNLPLATAQVISRHVDETEAHFSHIDAFVESLKSDEILQTPA